MAEVLTTTSHGLERASRSLSIPTSLISMLNQTTTSTPVSELKARYESDGYLWLKNAIPRQDVLDMRAHYFRTIKSTGILAPGSSPEDGLFNTDLDPLVHQGIGGAPQEEAERLLDQLHASSEYHTFLAHPALRYWIRQLTGWNEELILTRGLIRHNVPGTGFGTAIPSGVHYDQLFLRGGDPTFVTAWLPLGDCSVDGGGLMYLEDSIGLGKKIEANFLARQEHENMTQEERISAFNRHMSSKGHLNYDAAEWVQRDEGKDRGMKTRRWMFADYEAGDIVFHHPFMIHASGRNEDENGRIRLSSDLRFYEKGARRDPRWCRPYFVKDGL